MLASCASQATRLAAVGPAPALNGPTEGGKGGLQVFTETREYSDDDVYYFPHSAYQIETPAGKHVRYVWNHHTFQDEDPTLVALPAGKYLIEADAELCGRVLVPVIIKPGRTTRVVLQPGWNPNATVPGSDLVTSPTGYYIGWRPEKSG